MIELKAENMIGRGLHRECYVHPDDESKCIKVVVLRGEEETRREQAYYKFLQKRNISWQHLPQFYGNVETQKGPGAVFDLIRDHDAQVAKTLEHYLESAQLTQQLTSDLTQALLDLKAYLVDQNVITMNLKPKNIVYRQQLEQPGQLIIIDNIGNSDVVPICDYSRFFGRKKIERKWTRFQTLLQQAYPQNSALQSLLQTL